MARRASITSGPTVPCGISAVSRERSSRVAALCSLGVSCRRSRSEIVGNGQGISPSSPSSFTPVIPHGGDGVDGEAVPPAPSPEAAAEHTTDFSHCFEGTSAAPAVAEAAVAAVEARAAVAFASELPPACLSPFAKSTAVADDGDDGAAAATARAGDAVAAAAECDCAVSDGARCGTASCCCWRRRTCNFARVAFATWAPPAPKKKISECQRLLVARLRYGILQQEATFEKHQSAVKKSIRPKRRQEPMHRFSFVALVNFQTQNARGPMS